MSDARIWLRTRRRDSGISKISIRHFLSQRLGFLGTSLPSPSMAAYRSPFSVRRTRFPLPLSSRVAYPKRIRRLSDFSTPCRFWRGLISPSLPSAPSTLGALKATAKPPATASVVITALLILVLRIRDFTPASISPIHNILPPYE